MRVGDRERGRVRTGDARAVSDDRAIEQPGVGQRRRADGCASEGNERAHFHVLPDRMRDDGRELRREGKLIHPAAILAGLAGSIFLIREPHGLTARAHEERTLLPVHFAGEARLLCVVHGKNQRVTIRLARRLPPVSDRARSGDGGLHDGGLIVVHRLIARRVHEVVFDDGLADPAGRTRDPSEARGVERVGERQHGREGQHRVGTRGRAAEIRDEQRVNPRAVRRHIGNAQNHVRRAADVAAVHQRQAVETPAILESDAARDQRCEGDGGTRLRIMRHRLHEERRRRGRVAHVIHPHAIRSVGQREVLRIFPLHHGRAGRDGDDLLLPAHVAGNLHLQHAVHQEAQEVRVRLRRGAPPIPQRAGADDRRPHPRRVAVVHVAVAHGLVVVVAVVRRADEPREAARLPDQVGGIHRRADGRGGEDAQIQIAAEVHAGLVADLAGVKARLVRLRVGDDQFGSVHADDLRAGQEIRPRVTPLIRQRLRARGFHLETRGRALVHDVRVGRAVRDERRDVERFDLVHPAAIQSRAEAGVLVVFPTHHGAEIRQREGAALPADFAGNVRGLHAINHETQPVRVGLRGNFPPERDGQRAAVNRRLNPVR